RRLPVSGPAVELCCESQGVLELLEGKRLHALMAGRTKCWLRAADRGIESNRVEVEVLPCTGVDVICPDRVLLQGEHVRLTMLFRTPSGVREDLVVEARTRNDLLVEGMVDE